MGTLFSGKSPERRVQTKGFQGKPGGGTSVLGEQSSSWVSQLAKQSVEGFTGSFYINCFLRGYYCLKIYCSNQPLFLLAFRVWLPESGNYACRSRGP